MPAHLRRFAFDACHAAGSFFAVIAEFFFRQADRIMTGRDTFAAPIDPDPEVITSLLEAAENLPRTEPHE